MIQNMMTISRVYKHPPEQKSVNLRDVVTKEIMATTGTTTRCMNCDVVVLADWMLQVSVSDTGKGISDVMKPGIFDRFMQDSHKRSSYGLGLHIVKMLIEAYGGRIWADDRVTGDLSRVQ